ncbi:MAG TPA: BamA/TamA family outer membrane protein [Polyangiaceae bacterium]|jgi:hypothetical protein
MQRRGGIVAAFFSFLFLFAWNAFADDPDAAPPPAPAAPAPAATDDDGDANVPLRPPQGPLHRSKPPRGKAPEGDYWTERFEPAGFPLLGGDSDIGFEFGAVGTLSYFQGGQKPYRWNMDLLLSASLKQGPGGLEIAQQNYLWQIDLPGLMHGTMRLNPEVSYNHTVNYGYFGLGNASTGDTPQNNANPGRYHEWIESIAQVRSEARVLIHRPVYAEFAAQYLYVAPDIYADSQLAGDKAATRTDGSPWIYGATPLSLPSLAAGFSYDSRDDEIFPHSGMLHEVGARFEAGFPTDGGVRYVEAGGIFRGFVPLGNTFVLAGRLVLNAQMGNVPFYDLFQAGPFDQKEMPGGSAGIRGVPVGRYLGPIKVVGNIELRAMYIRFTLLGQKFTLGNDLFFDTGRVWSDYSFHSALDGSGVGLKYGVGAGIYLLWGQAAMLRVEAAYSPDAVSENPTLPLGIYVEDGTMF